MSLTYRYFFVLSGEHETLPLSEINAIFEINSISYEVLKRYHSSVLIETDKILSLDILHRLTYTKRVCTLLSIEKNEDALVDFVKNHTFIDHHTSSFKVSVVSKEQKIDTQSLMQKIGALIQSKTRKKVSLTHAEIEYFCIFEDDVLFGETIFIQKDQFSKRSPKKKPCFSPGTIKTKLSRVLVNLSRIRPGEVLLDPFCGCGAFLIEAALMNISIVGFDINPKIVEYAKKNLEFYNIPSDRIFVSDATSCEKMSVDAIVCDPPYGRTTKKSVEDLVLLYKNSLSHLSSFLKSGRYFVILSPDSFDLEGIGKKSGVDLVETHFDRVHKSLTRKICVFRKI